MKQVWILSVLVSLTASSGYTQEPIYRCGNEYTNTKPDALTKGCKLVEGGNVTVVQGIRVPKTAAPSAKPVNSNSTASGSRVVAVQQKARDSDARLILLEELKKTQIRQDELNREYNNGEPEKRGEETRNHQKYLDRVAELKANLARNASDMAGIQRELDRLSAAR